MITLSLAEILSKCSCTEWEKFCEEFGWSVWAVNEGGGHLEVSLSIEKAKEYGIL